MFLNTLTKKIETNCQIAIFFCNGIINLLFDGLAYNTSGHFAHCSYFSSPLRGSEKYYATVCLTESCSGACFFFFHSYFLFI